MTLTLRISNLRTRLMLNEQSWTDGRVALTWIRPAAAIHRRPPSAAVPIAIARVSVVMLVMCGLGRIASNLFAFAGPFAGGTMPLLE
jgi:hypothetical protein